MSPPKVIFFDAVGTLFGVRGSVGTIYAELAHNFGVTVDHETLNRAFFETFKGASPMAFPGVSWAEIPQREYEWWRAIAQQTYDKAGVLEQFSDFERFFRALYDYFETADPWFVYADTFSTIKHWRDQGIQLGVLSNFDSRLHAVLSALGLAEFFDSVTISTEAGAAKPDPQVFQVALSKHNCLPMDAWHIGDSYREDYQGAQAAGLRGIWLNRS